jgi:glycosyltransferase involved in cell wall biosynthesis
MLTSLCKQLEADDITQVTCAKLLSNGSVIREAGISFDEQGDAIINGLGQHWLTPEFSYCQEVDSALDAPVCFRTNELLDSLLKFSAETSISRALFAVLKDVKDRNRKVILCPKAMAFSAPGPLSHSEIAKLDDHPVKFSLATGHIGQNARNTSKRILMFDATTPTPDRDAGSYAAIKEIELIKSLGFEITFVPMDLEYKVQYTADLQNMGVEVLYQPFFMQLQVVLDERLAMVDAVYITRYSVAEKVLDYIKENRPDIPVIFNNADLHFLREIRTALAEQNDDGLVTALKTRDEELAVIKKADVVLSYSDAEIAVITSLVLTQDKLFKCPWVVTPKTSGKPFIERQGIAFLGGYKHLPNVAAVDFFVTQVMPLITANSPHITFSIYGSNIPERFKLYESDNVKIVGYIDDLEEIFHHCRVFVCPLISGAGIKGKVLESLSYGVPTVLSNTAAEGTGLIDGLTTIIADDPESWVRAIDSLYEDESLWQSISQNQGLLADSLYTFEHGQNEMRKIFKFANLL